MKTLNLSIVIPIHNEAASIPELISELQAVLQHFHGSYEIIFVDDGSKDGTFELLKQARQKNRNLNWIRLRSRFGKAAALSAGFRVAAGEIVITMDGDLQDDPAEIPKFIEKINEGFDVVSGWKHRRHDPIPRVIMSKIYNMITSQVSGIRIHDFNCGFKAYRRAVIKEVHIYGELHRYIPLLAAQRGFRITEIKVNHRSRKHGRSRYGSERIINGLLDLLTVTFLTRFTKKPSHFFGTIGLALTTVGLVINYKIFYLRIIYGNIQGRYPLLFLGILLTIVGIQFFSTGLLAEMITLGQKKSEIEYSVLEESE